MSKKYEILRPKEYSGRQIALPEEEFWELAKDLEDMKLEISTLEKENQELKDKNKSLIEYSSQWSKECGCYEQEYTDTITDVIGIREVRCDKCLLKDQFLKVVESVVKEHFPEYDTSGWEWGSGASWYSCLCGEDFEEMEDWHKHLLQEIKSSMEKEGE